MRMIGKMSIDELRGITWDHPRGLAPLVAASAAFERDHGDAHITWETRSLHAFGAQPLDELVHAYDLLVIDHPFVGSAARHGYLLPLDAHLPAPFLDAQAAQSVGPSHRSYRYDGHQWALAIDAAAQVSAYRPDVLRAIGVGVPCTWDAVLDLADCGAAARIALPLTAVNAISSFLTLCANHGEPPGRDAARLVSRPAGRTALALLRHLVAVAHPASLDLDPPALLDRMSATDEIAYCPLVFGYSNYARPGDAPHLCRFSNIPGPAADAPPRGALLGGAGLAISASCRAIPAACAYAQWVANADCQRTVYATSGGQPGNRVAWTDATINDATSNFFLDTLETLDLAYLRPRYAGFAAFQDNAGLIVREYLRDGRDGDAALDRIDALYARSGWEEDDCAR